MLRSSRSERRHARCLRPRMRLLPLLSILSIVSCGARTEGRGDISDDGTAPPNPPSTERGSGRNPSPSVIATRECEAPEVVDGQRIGGIKLWHAKRTDYGSVIGEELDYVAFDLPSAPALASLNGRDADRYCNKQFDIAADERAALERELGEVKVCTERHAGTGRRPQSFVESEVTLREIPGFSLAAGGPPPKDRDGTGYQFVIYRHADGPVGFDAPIHRFASGHEKLIAHLEAITAPHVDDTCPARWRDVFER